MRPFSPVAHHPAEIPPGDRHGPDRNGLATQGFGHVVVGPVGSTRIGLEPGLLHPQPCRKSMELVIGVGDEVGPEGIHMTETGPLSPVVDVNGQCASDDLTGRAGIGDDRKTGGGPGQHPSVQVTSVVAASDERLGHGARPTAHPAYAHHRAIVRKLGDPVLDLPHRHMGRLRCVAAIPLFVLTDVEQKRSCLNQVHRFVGSDVLDHMMCRFAHALTVLGPIPRPRAIACVEPLGPGAQRGPLRARGSPPQLDFRNLPRLGESLETGGLLRALFAQTWEI
jgi:hypothetical protein